MHTISLPFYDETGLTPLVIEAMAAGATSANDPNNPDKIILTFESETARNAFADAIGLEPLQLYWGVSSKDTLAALDVEALGNSEPANTFAKTVTYNCTGGRYPYIAYPAQWGTPENVTVGGLAFSDLVIADISDVDGSDDYRVIRFGYLQNGKAINVVWA